MPVLQAKENSRQKDNIAYVQILSEQLEKLR